MIFLRGKWLNTIKLALFSPLFYLIILLLHLYPYRMKPIYLDNAATTAIDPQVVEAMLPYLTEKFGNPSSVYSVGRETRLAVEMARKTVAQYLGAQPGEIFFTSCGTESINTAVTAAVNDLGCTTIITSPIEHHATLHSVEHAAQSHNVALKYVSLDEKGHVEMDSLKALLEAAEGRCLVSLMHANNEIGNLLKVKNVSKLCKEYDAVFLCDTVQTVAHYPINVKDLGADFITCSAHKFHGPKGVGFLYINDAIKIHPYIHGGGQERNLRAGTENVYGIVGLAKALELCMEHHQEEFENVSGLKTYMIELLKANFEGLHFNGDYDGSSLYTVLNVGFPQNDKTDMLLLTLDMAGVCVSGGSACSSGANQGSHVISSIYPEVAMNPIRFSFSRFNTKEEIDTVIQRLKELLA